MSVEAAILDITNAYSYVLQQRLDWWLQCFVWHGGVRYSLRVVFGGAWGPSCFMEVVEVPRLAATMDIDAFDADQPPPASMLNKLQFRKQLQTEGSLPQGREQHSASHRLTFIDDTTLMAPNDPVRVPDEFATPTLHQLNTRAVGGTPSLPDSRILVHVRIFATWLRRLGFAVASKTQSGDIIISLGIRINIPALRLDCPEVKRWALIAICETHLRSITHGETINIASLESCVGRLCNISQVEAALILWLHAGYAIVYARHRRTGRRPREVLVPRNSGRGKELVELLTVAISLLELNEGAAMLCGEFSPLKSRGSLVSATDASLQPTAAPGSEDDGFGGFAFHRDRPRTAFILSRSWPAGIRSLMLTATTRRADRPADAEYISMPAAELFAAMAMEELVHAEVLVQVAFDIIDCKPAATAITAATSASAQLRVLLRRLGAQRSQRLAVHVPRELNTDPDQLSHPSMACELIERAEAGGWHTHRFHMPDDHPLFDVLREAATEHAGNGGGGSDIQEPTVARMGRVPASAEILRVTRPSAMGNPFAVLRRGSQVESWRDPVCDAFDATLVAALTGVSSSLTAIAEAHGLPEGSVQRPYATLNWAAYSTALRAAIAGLQTRVAAGEAITLVCACYPKRCHASSIAHYSTHAP